MDKNRSLARIAAMKGTLGATVFVVLVIMVISGGHALAIDVIAPAVSSTSPANGALGVAADLGVIVVTFTEPMKGNVNYNYSPSWGPHTTQWSDELLRRIPP